MMHHRGRPLTRHQGMEAKKRHRTAMIAVLAELRAVVGAEEPPVVPESPAQQRAQQWQKESG